MAISLACGRRDHPTVRTAKVTLPCRRINPGRAAACPSRETCKAGQGACIIPTKEEEAMPPAELLQLLRRRPFVPFRIHLDEGTTYEVRHPELVMVSVGAAIVGFPDPSHPGMYTSHEIVSLRHIARLEPLEAPTASA
jgi:hypothetical protein